MNLLKRVACCVVGLSVAGGLYPHDAWSQEKARSFETLEDALKVDEVVTVVDRTGQRVTGRVAEVSAVSLVLLLPAMSRGEETYETNGERRLFTADHVTEVMRVDASGMRRRIYRSVPSRPTAPTTTFGELANITVTGQHLDITNSIGRLVSGRLVTISDSTIVVQTSDGSETVALEHTRQVRRQADPLWNGMLAGALVGLGGGLALGATLDASRGEGTWLAPMLMLTGLGAGAAAGLLGDAIRPHDDVLFVNRQLASRRTGVRVGPFLGARGYGMRLSTTF